MTFNYEILNQIKNILINFITGILFLWFYIKNVTGLLSIYYSRNNEHIFVKIYAKDFTIALQLFFIVIYNFIALIIFANNSKIFGLILLVLLICTFFRAGFIIKTNIKNLNSIVTGFKIIIDVEFSNKKLNTFFAPFSIKYCILFFILVLSICILLELKVLV
jgi:hypothetical protein